MTAFLVLFHCPITQPFDLLSLLSCKVMGGAFPLCFFHLRAVVWCHPLLYSTINEVVSVKTRFKFTKAEHSPCASNAFQLVFLLPRPFPDRHLVNDGTFPHCVVTAAFTRHSEIGLPWPFTDPALTVPSRPVTSCCKGLTVHIDNTDAEGRLVLADALTYTQKHISGVDTIFDFATLTGACITAVGTYFAGMWSNDDAVADAVASAATSTAGEKVWR